MFPGKVHRACLKHLEPKVLAKHGGDRKGLQSLFWLTACTASPSAADDSLQTMQELHPEAHEHLTTAVYTGKDGKQKRGLTKDMWMNSQSGEVSWGKTSSSGAEAKNAATLKLQFRRLPPPMMMKAITTYIEKRIVKVAARAAKYQ
jgi:hypothetical protein